MSGKIEELKAILETEAAAVFIKWSRFIDHICRACIDCGLKNRDFRKLWKQYQPDTYDEDKAEEMYEQCQQNIETGDAKSVSLQDIDDIIRKLNEKEATAVQTVSFARQHIHKNAEYLKLKKYFEETEGWCKVNHPKTYYGRVLKNKDFKVKYNKDDKITNVKINHNEFGISFEACDNPNAYFKNKNFATETTNDKGKTFEKWHNFYDIWEKDPEIKTYDYIVFDPTMRNPNDLNTFSEYCAIGKANNCKFTKLDRVFEHMKSICGYDQHCYDYLLKFFAHVVQKPHIRTDVAVVMYGKEGVGKNILLQLLGSVIGQQFYAESSNPKDLFGDFATGMYKRMVFVYDEGDKKDTGGFMNRLKTLVTGKKLRVELKGKDTFEVDTYCRLFFPTNNTQPFPITEGARRWFYIKASNKFIELPDNQRHEHFDSLANHFEERDLIHSFYKYLSAIPLDGFNPNNFPKSEGLKQATQIPLILRCLHAKITSKKEQCGTLFKAKTLLDIVNNYCKENNYSYQGYNPTTLGAELQRYLDFGCLEKKTRNTGVHYVFCYDGFRDYIKKNNFNLDDFDVVDSDEGSLEDIDAEIKRLETLLQQKREKRLQLCDKLIGFDPEDHDVDPIEYGLLRDAISEPQPAKLEETPKILPSSPKQFVLSMGFQDDESIKETNRIVSCILLKNIEKYNAIDETHPCSVITKQGNKTMISYDVCLTDQCQSFVMDKFLEILKMNNYIEKVLPQVSDFYNLFSIEYHHNVEELCPNGVTEKVQQRINDAWLLKNPAQSGKTSKAKQILDNNIDLFVI